MRMPICLLMGLLLTLGTYACWNKEKDKLPDHRNKVSMYANIPSFKVMFLAMDKIGEQDIHNPGPILPEVTRQDTMRLAFLWGALTAEAQIAIRARDAMWLNADIERLNQLAPDLGLTHIAAKLNSGARALLSQTDWDGLQTMFYNLQGAVEQHWLDHHFYEIYTLVTLGQWTQGSNQLGMLIERDYTTEKSRLLLQREAWTNLTGNLSLFTNQRFLTSPVYKPTLARVKEISTLMDMNAQGVFSEEQVRQIVEATDAVKAAIFSSTIYKEQL